MVRDEKLYFDSTKVMAIAEIDTMISKVEQKANQHLEQLCSEKQDWNPESVSPIVELVSKFDGERIPVSVVVRLILSY